MLCASNQERLHEARRHRRCYRVPGCSVSFGTVSGCQRSLCKVSAARFWNVWCYSIQRRWHFQPSDRRHQGQQGEVPRQGWQVRRLSRVMREWGEPRASSEEVERDDRRMSIVVVIGSAVLLGPLLWRAVGLIAKTFL